MDTEGLTMKLTFFNGFKLYVRLDFFRNSHFCEKVFFYKFFLFFLGFFSIIITIYIDSLVTNILRISDETRQHRRHISLTVNSVHRLNIKT